MSHKKISKKSKEKDLSIDHAALLLFYVNKPITEKNIQKIFSSIGINIDEKEVKATVDTFRIKGLAETIIKVSEEPVCLYSKIKIIFNIVLEKLKNI